MWGPKLAAWLLGALWLTLLGAPPAAAQDRSCVVRCVPAACPAPRRRLWRQYRLGSPVQDVQVQSSLQAALPTLVDVGFEAFAGRHPRYRRSRLAHLAELGVDYGFGIQWWVLSHEYGHYQAGKAFRWGPQIVMRGYGSGLTRYEDFPPAPDVDMDLAATAAGMNQSQLNQMHLFRDWALSGALRPAETVAFLLNRTDTAWYFLRVSDDTSVPTDKDPRNYIRLLNAKGIDVTLDDVRRLAVLADVLSVSSFAAVWGQLRFLATGRRYVAVPTLPIHRTRVTLPNFHLLLGAEGPIPGGTIYVNPTGRWPVEVRADVRYDGKAFALTAALPYAPVPRTARLRMSPLLRYVRNAQGGAGYAAGGGLHLWLARWLMLGVDVVYHHRDLVRAVERFGVRGGDGWEAGLELRVGL